MATARIYRKVQVIRLAKMGCTNRPFYHIVLADKSMARDDPGLEQLGTFDPISNKLNQKVVSFNYERLKQLIGRGVEITEPVEKLLGLAGFYPIHPRIYMIAKRNRDKQTQQESSSSPVTTDTDDNDTSKIDQENKS